MSGRSRSSRPARHAAAANSSRSSGTTFGLSRVRGRHAKPATAPRVAVAMACTTTLATAGATTVTLAATSGVQAQAMTQGDEAVAYASRFAGVPYVYGGSTPAGFDCSGFTSYVYRHVGVELPRTSGAQYDALPRVAQGDRLPGDLLFFFSGGRVSHVAIYAGNNEMWAAPSTGDVVKKQAVYTSSYSVGRPWSGGSAAPPPPPALSPDNAAILAHWNALGGAGGPLGPPTTPYTRIPGGAYINFAFGGITSDGNGGNVRETHGEIRGKWGQTGYERGVLGFPVTDELPTLGGKGRFNNFQRGSISWSPATGAHEVHGDIRAKYGVLGSEPGVLGFPTTDELPTVDGKGRFNNFENGSISWSPTTGAHAVYGDIRRTYAVLGSEPGVLGFPTTDELSTADGRGRFNDFQRGTVTWTPATGAVATTGAIHQTWTAAGRERGDLGLPVAAAANVSPTVVEQRFQRGVIRFDATVGAARVIR